VTKRIYWLKNQNTPYDVVVDAAKIKKMKTTVDKVK